MLISRGPLQFELEFPPDPGGMLAWVEEAYAASLELLMDAGVHSGPRMQKQGEMSPAAPVRTALTLAASE
jgi:hypothetical protein